MSWIYNIVINQAMKSLTYRSFSNSIICFQILGMTSHLQFACVYDWNQPYLFLERNFAITWTWTWDILWLTSKPKMWRYRIIVSLLLCSSNFIGGKVPHSKWGDWQSWGDWQEVTMANLATEQPQQLILSSLGKIMLYVPPLVLRRGWVGQK